MTDQTDTDLPVDAGLFDLQPGEELVEKVVALALSAGSADQPVLVELYDQLEGLDTSALNVVVFGGGTGLSNLVGGDSRHPDWPSSPFRGLKEIFPKAKSIVCVTDDGGSTGELLKDLELIAIGDLRHVLLSSVSLKILQDRYGLVDEDCHITVAILHRLFNYRFSQPPADLNSLLTAAEIDLSELPAAMSTPLGELLAALFTDDRLAELLQRPHCLGNLLVVSAICSQSDRADFGHDNKALLGAFRYLADLLGAGREAVLPCAMTPAHLKLLYSNGVMVSGEYKAGHARRGCPVERLFIHFHGEPQVPDAVLDNINDADIIIFAPGSLYTSIIPILQLPKIAGAVRKNKRALKILAANLWAQQGETDLVACPSRRRFHVSDLLLAYHRNIPGGVDGLFQQVMVLSLQDIPGSILQSYALEGKVPIYFDRDRVIELGFMVVECPIFSGQALEERFVVQHDPEAMARAVRAVWLMHKQLSVPGQIVLPLERTVSPIRVGTVADVPARRLAAITDLLGNIDVESPLKERLLAILWQHRDISIDHLAYLDGVVLIDNQVWSRNQKWDRIFSFYDPHDRTIKIRQDILDDQDRLELAFLVALGESLLGSYAAKKEMLSVENGAGQLGRNYQLTLSAESDRRCFFSDDDLQEYLELARMCRSDKRPEVYTRLLNGQEGFTPPGLLFGLVFAWYLDNRFTPHIEYKMALLGMEVPDMIPEQGKVCARRRRLVDFFRQKVFGCRGE